MLEIVEKAFPEYGVEEIRKLIPSYGVKLRDDEKLAKKVRGESHSALGLVV